MFQIFIIDFLNVDSFFIIYISFLTLPLISNVKVKIFLFFYFILAFSFITNKKKLIYEMLNKDM